VDKQFVDSAKLIETSEQLTLRIGDRFTNCGLEKVARNLSQIAKETPAVIEWINRPDYLWRGITYAFIAAVALSLLYPLTELRWPQQGMMLGEFVQLLESSINNIALIGAAMIFIISLETRKKRMRVISAINKLRALAHVIDMHQLTKDPYMLSHPDSTQHSPQREMSLFELSRYLDYCTEMLSITSKIGFLYIQEFDDPICVDAVNDLENLCIGLARKIWQKIMMAQSYLP